MLNIAIFISGRGSNMRAILQAIDSGALAKVKVATIVSDNPHADGLSIAKSMGYDAQYIDASPFKTKLEGAGEERYIAHLSHYDIGLICLAGFMRVLKPKLINRYKRRILNVHPSLLPKYKGLNAQQQAIEARDSTSGCTLHFVDSDIDTGEIIDQASVAMDATDTVEILSQKILIQEHKLYVKVLKKIGQKKIKIG